MTDSEKLLKIRELLLRRSQCLCGLFERCELCSADSQVNKLKAEIREVIDGPTPKPTLEDYGRTFTVKF